jgi:hypothetical protein
MDERRGVEIEAGLTLLYTMKMMRWLHSGSLVRRLCAVVIQNSITMKDAAKNKTVGE